MRSASCALVETTVNPLGANDWVTASKAPGASFFGGDRSISDRSGHQCISRRDHSLIGSQLSIPIHLIIEPNPQIQGVVGESFGGDGRHVGERCITQQHGIKSSRNRNGHGLIGLPILIPIACIPPIQLRSITVHQRKFELACTVKNSASYKHTSLKIKQARSLCKACQR